MTEGEQTTVDGYSSPKPPTQRPLSSTSSSPRPLRTPRGEVRLGLSDLAERHPGREWILLEPSRQRRDMPVHDGERSRIGKESPDRCAQPDPAAINQRLVRLRLTRRGEFPKQP